MVLGLLDRHVLHQYRQLRNVGVGVGRLRVARVVARDQPFDLLHSILRLHGSRTLVLFQQTVILVMQTVILVLNGSTCGTQRTALLQELALHYKYALKWKLLLHGFGNYC